MTDPRTVKLRGKRTASVLQGRIFAANADRLSFFTAYNSELSVCAHKAGLDYAVLLAESSEETSRWTSAVWNKYGNPAGMKTENGADYIRFSGGKSAARAHVVQMCAYVYGYIPPKSGLQRYKPLAPRFDIAARLFGGSVARLSHLGSGRWAEDDHYARNIAQHYDELIRTDVPTGPTFAANDPGPVHIETSPNHFGRPLKITRQVFHITDDMVYDHTRSWFLTEESQASSSYVIDRDGTAVQFCDPVYYSPWTNGDVANPRRDIPSLMREIQSGNNLNLYCISYEAIGTPNQPPTDAQYETLIRLAGYNAQRFNLNRNRSHMNRHADINSVSRPYCPGPQYNLERIIRGIGGDPNKMDD